MWHQPTLVSVFSILYHLPCHWHGLVTLIQGPPRTPLAPGMTQPAAPVQHPPVPVAPPQSSAEALQPTSNLLQDPRSVRPSSPQQQHACSAQCHAGMYMSQTYCMPSVCWRMHVDVHVLHDIKNQICCGPHQAAHPAHCNSFMWGGSTLAAHLCDICLSWQPRFAMHIYGRILHNCILHVFAACGCGMWRMVHPSCLLPKHQSLPHVLLPAYECCVH